MPWSTARLIEVSGPRQEKPNEANLCENAVLPAPGVSHIVETTVRQNTSYGHEDKTNRLHQWESPRCPVRCVANTPPASFEAFGGEAGRR